MATFNMYVGLPASGKTTIAHQHEKDYVIIDSDEVRLRILGDAQDQSQNARVFEHMFRETCECLAKGISVAYVATNVSMKRRINLLSSLQKKFPDVDYVCSIINTPLDECYSRNSKREKYVPTYVIDRMVRSFQVPVAQEGWDLIIVIDNYDKGETKQGQRTMIEKRVEDFGSQQNEHHTLSLAAHCQLCGKIAFSKQYHYHVIQACFIHDYGKTWTAIRWDKDGGKNLHFPNHENVGAYLALNMGYNLSVAALVNYHMLHYQDAHAQQVWQERLGADLWEQLEQVFICDKEAH